jgi:hypothetical protein
MRVVLDVVPLTAVVSSVVFRLAPDSGRSAISGKLKGRVEPANACFTRIS